MREKEGSEKEVTEHFRENGITNKTSCNCDRMFKDTIWYSNYLWISKININKRHPVLTCAKEMSLQAL